MARRGRNIYLESRVKLCGKRSEARHRCYGALASGQSLRGAQIMVTQRIDGSLTADQLRARLHYNPRTGSFTWKPRKAGDRFNSWAGRPAGCWKHGPFGYLLIRVNNQLFRAHRLAFLWMTGKWPEHEVDHCDGDPKNNRWKNLRVATPSQNRMNTVSRSDNTSGYRGVWFEKRRSHWVAEICAGGTRHHLGSFPTAEAASAARDRAAKRLHGKFAR